MVRCQRQGPSEKEVTDNAFELLEPRHFYNYRHQHTSTPAHINIIGRELHILLISFALKQDSRPRLQPSPALERLCASSSSSRFERSQEVHQGRWEK